MTSPLTKLIADLEAVEAGATPDKWFATAEDWPSIVAHDPDGGTRHIARLGNHYGMNFGKFVDEDAVFIARFRNAAAPLLAIIKIQAQALADVERNYDHETDAHKYDNGACRCCNAEKAIAAANTLAEQALGHGFKCHKCNKFDHASDQHECAEGVWK